MAAAAAAAASAGARMSSRNLAVKAFGVGAAAGCMGTWFEMSHGIVCIPVLGLPPFNLPQQVAIGSTVFGVAARQALSATLYAADPNTDLEDLEGLSEVIDFSAAGVLAASGTFAAFGASALAARLPQRPVKRANGLCLVAIALFLNWRSHRDRRLAELAEAEEAAEGPAAQQPVAASGPTVAAAGAGVPSPSDLTPAQLGNLRASPVGEFPRLISLGAISGAFLGFFGIGPAWMLAPILSVTAPVRQDAAPGPMTAATARASGATGPQPAGGDVGGSAGPTADDERMRTTACLAMVPPSLAAAWNHYQMGHVTNMAGVALPLAAGAILGSAIGGQELADVPCEEDFKYGLSMLLFAHGCWSFLRP